MDMLYIKTFPDSDRVMNASTAPMPDGIPDPFPMPEQWDWEHPFYWRVVGNALVYDPEE